MTPHKKGRKWEIIYRIPGYSKLFTERFDSEAEAKLRCAQIEYAKQTGTIAPPVRKEKIHPKTMGELLDEYVELYGVGHWGDSYYSLTKHRIEDYIKPAIGNLLVKDVTPRVLDALYADMLNTQAKVLPGHKDTTKTISYPVIEKCHCVIRSALNQAVRWGYIPSNPALASMVPKAPSKRRDVWTPAEAQKAISVCTDPNLKVCLLLSIGCSLRLGEILVGDDAGLAENRLLGNLLSDALQLLRHRLELLHRSAALLLWRGSRGGRARAGGRLSRELHPRADAGLAKSGRADCRLPDDRLKLESGSARLRKRVRGRRLFTGYRCHVLFCHV